MVFRSSFIFLTFALALCHFASTTRAATVFFDDFDQGLGNWQIVNKNTNYYSLSNGILNLRASSGDMYEGRTDYKNLFLTATPSADFQVTMRVSAPLVNRNAAQFNIVAFDNNNNYVRCAYGHIGGNRRLALAVESSGVYNGGANLLINFQSNYFYFRLTKTGNVYSQSYSTDGTTYHTTATRSYGDGTPTYLGFIAMVDPTQSMHAYVDSFEVDDLIPEPEPEQVPEPATCIMVSLGIITGVLRKRQA